jgi:hypothetical protein
MKIRKPKKARMFHGHQKYTDNLVVIKFSETTFGILKKIEKEWILGSIPHK